MGRILAWKDSEEEGDKSAIYKGDSGDIKQVSFMVGVGRSEQIADF